jgi:hypothetical protein
MATMVGCQACGKSLEVGSTFCNFCGAAQGGRAANVTPPPIPQLETSAAKARGNRALGLIAFVAGFGLMLTGTPLAALGLFIMWGAATVALSGGLIKRVALGFVAAFVGAMVAVSISPPAMTGRSTSSGTGSSTSSGSAVGERVATPSSPAPARSAQWTTVKTWSGSGMKETETFTTTNREWRIKWTTSNEPFANVGLIQLFVYDGDGTMVTLAANKQGPGSDVSYVRSAPGKHYLMINSANIDWDVTVEEER